MNDDSRTRAFGKPQSRLTKGAGVLWIRSRRPTMQPFAKESTVS